jgi:hypothetical protein
MKLSEFVFSLVATLSAVLVQSKDLEHFDNNQELVMKKNDILINEEVLDNHRMLDEDGDFFDDARRGRRDRRRRRDRS